MRPRSGHLPVLLYFLFHYSLVLIVCFALCPRQVPEERERGGGHGQAERRVYGGRRPQGGRAQDHEPAAGQQQADAGVGGGESSRAAACSGTVTLLLSVVNLTL